MNPKIGDNTPKVGDNIFVYGTLRKGQHAHGLIKDDVIFVADTVMPGMLMYNIGGGAFPGLKQGSGLVHGEVYKITGASLPARLDRYEGYPDLYQRMQLQTESGDMAWVYVFNRDVKESQLIASGDWNQHTSTRKAL